MLVTVLPARVAFVALSSTMPIPLPWENPVIADRHRIAISIDTTAGVGHGVVLHDRRRRPAIDERNPATVAITLSATVVWLPVVYIAVP